MQAIISDRSGGCNRLEVGDIKISTLEKVLLGITAAALLLAAGYFLGTRSGGAPYRVEARPAAETRIPLPTPEPPAPETPGRVNINTADAAELETLPGIGEKRAADIVADRAANGPFRIPEDLDRVDGIGPDTLEGLMDYITVE